jgi:DNA-directed RNA polymerase subunit beta'
MLNKDFDGLLVRLASPEDIKEWSHGAVETPDTINYRTGKPKPKGLFCEVIFWPVRNYECSCWKYKGVRYKGIVCERCWVEVTSSRVRRERMWHIELAAPVVHVWYYKATPSRIWLLLNLSVKEIEKILYFVKYVVIDVDEERKKNALWSLDKEFNNKLKELEKVYKEELEAIKSLSWEEYKIKKEEIEKTYSKNKEELQQEYSRIKSILANLKVWSTILESDYRNIFYRYEGIFRFESGAEAILHLLQKINVEEEIKKMIESFSKLKWSEREKAFKRLRLLINLHISWVKPEWMVLRYLPVIPPDLRPVVQLEWWKFASSDINLFYRRVLMRNLRLKKMIAAWMPDVIKKNEIRLLQEAVNNLIIWEKNNTWTTGAGVKVFKSLTDMLSWKEWIFRKNLLWKRVDYSWRSVITVWPKLRLDECWLPLYIAIRIFAPFVIAELIKRKFVHTPKQAEKLIKDEDPRALEILKDVIKNKYVLLNRAPTLHRLGIQAFKVKLMPWKTIRIHPLVCPAFNADFDGDQMAVHLPLSDEAQREARELIASDKNILKPASWEPIITHTQDMVLWAYYLTDDYGISDNIVAVFNDLNEVREAYDRWDLNIKDKIKIRFNWEFIETSVWRVLFNLLLPEKLRFINEKVWKKQLKKILDKIYDLYWREITVKVADDIKDWWFKFATLSAVTMNVFDLIVPPEKKELIKQWEEKVTKIHNLWYKGFLSDEEKHELIVKVWSEIKAEIERLIKKYYKSGNDIFMLIDSWARGNWGQLTQLSGMKWLVASPSWEIIELPIKSSLIEGFSPIEYFISAHGARKGKADTALRTAESWYLTRRLVDATQEVIIREEDCGTTEGLLITKDEAIARWEDFLDLLYGRVLFEDIKDKDGNVVIKAWTMLDKPELKIIEELGIDAVKVRSPLTCKTPSWVCQKCYGMDLATRKMVEIWTPVGVIASQSIGEPWTQLTMRTFHTWGIAAAEWDITQGIKRVEELFEVRRPKNPAVIAPFDWIVKFHKIGKLLELEMISKPEPKVYIIKEWYTLTVKKGDYLKKWWVYAIKWKSQLKVKEEWEVLEVHEDYIVLWVVRRVKKQISSNMYLKVKDGDEIYKWQPLTAGAYDIREYRDIVWDLEAQKYIVKEVKKVYTSQWQEVNDKYMEIVVKQLFSKVLIKDAGDSSFIPGSIVRYEEFVRTNEELKKQWKHPAKWERLILWLTQVAKETDSWLSAASFQETMRVMVDASTRWAIDTLEDLKSNVILGRLLPIWEVYRKKYEKIKQKLKWEEKEDNNKE